MVRTLLPIVLVPGAALLTWLGLGGQQPRADLVVACPEPRTLDPHRASWLAEIQLAAAMFEGLTRLNPESFRPEPAVASGWEVSDAGTVYTFYLRPEARWSNGEPVLAEDFRCGWLRVLDPQCQAQYASLMFVIRGAEPYYRSRTNADPGDDLPPEAVGIAAPSPGVLRVALVDPCPYFLDLTSFITFAPVHRPTLESWACHGGRMPAGTRHEWTRPGRMVCNGPFVLARWDFKQRIWLERNRHYWDAEAIGIESIEGYVTSDTNAALIAYATGRVDLVSPVERHVAETLLAETRAGRRRDFHSGERFATFFYRANCRRPPLDDANLRKALSLAIDREAICRHVLRLGETPAYSYVPRAALALMARPSANGQSVCYQPPAGLGADLNGAQRVALARDYLRRSGFDRAAARRPIEIAFPPEPEQRLLAEAIQAMWETTLGIRVELRMLEGKVLSAKIRDLDYDLARSDWFGDYLDPSTFLDMFTSHSGQNRTGWCCARYDELLAAAARESDNRRRFELFREAERILTEEELPILPVFFRRGNYLLNPCITGIYDNVRDLLLIHRARRLR